MHETSLGLKSKFLRETWRLCKAFGAPFEAAERGTEELGVFLLPDFKFRPAPAPGGRGGEGAKKGVRKRGRS